ncbi:MAG: tRNA (adenosine(37)-N6)-threonylcarbamoyltransferase complex ATPase subunit type 1 TsaE [bacterium]
MEPEVKKRISGRTRLMEVGREVGETLKAGDVVALVGPKGVGKTVLARAVIEALDVKESFAPSAFVTCHSYRTGRLPVHHLNLAYLGGPYEFCSAGMDQWLDTDGVTITSSDAPGHGGQHRVVSGPEHVQQVLSEVFGQVGSRWGLPRGSPGPCRICR